MNKPSEALIEIQQKLDEATNKDALAATEKFVPGSTQVRGVRMPVLNTLAKEYKTFGFSLIEELWLVGIFEERMIALKLLHFASRKDLDKTIELINVFVPDIHDWATCDTMGMQSVKHLYKKRPDTLWEMALNLQARDSMWEQRVGIVFMWHYTALPNAIDKIEKQLSKFDGSKEKYIKKAVAWISRDIEKYRKKREG